MTPLEVFDNLCTEVRAWLKTKGELVEDRTFLRGQVAHYVARCEELAGEKRDLEELVAEQRLLLRALGDEEVGA